MVASSEGAPGLAGYKDTLTSLYLNIPNSPILFSPPSHWCRSILCPMGLTEWEVLEGKGIQVPLLLYKPPALQAVSSILHQQLHLCKSEEIKGARRLLLEEIGSDAHHSFWIHLLLQPSCTLFSFPTFSTVLTTPKGGQQFPEACRKA